MSDNSEKTHIETNKRAVWAMLDALRETPRYPAIVRRLDITHDEAEYFDHELSYEEQYDEELQLREGFIVAALDEIGQLIGVGDAVILDIEKRALLRVPRVQRCGLVLPMVSQGSIQQPRDYLTYFEVIQEALQRFSQSHQKRTLRCPQTGAGDPAPGKVRRA